MVWPVKAGTRITANFRQTSAVNWKTCGHHTGTDFGSFDGDPIYAVEDGNVWRRYYGDAFGLTCALSPDTPGEWQYSHLQSIDVPNGARVKAGQRIATSGRSGNVAPHLHLEWKPNHKNVWRCGIQADPIKRLGELNASSSSDYPKPTSNTVYLSKLKFGQKDSDSVWYLQRALGMDEQYWTGYYGPLTDAAVRSCQEKHVPPADPEGKSFVGAKQAEHLFGDTTIKVVNDLPKEDEPEPNPRELNGLRGIDISSHQTGIDLTKVPGDFVIIKTTEGSTWPANGSAPQVEYTRQYKQAVEAGKLVGLYHWAGNKDNPGVEDAVREADWFISSVRSLGADNGKTLLVLDWEENPNGDKAWALAWLQRVEDVLGVTPVFYTYLNVANGSDWSEIGKNYPLWLAAYGANNPPAGYDHTTTTPPKLNLNYWPNDYTIWQYTSKGDLPGYSGNLDLNVSDLTKAEWLELCASSLPIPEPKPDEFFYEVPIITFNMPPRYDTDGVEGDKAMLRELMSQCDILGLQEAAHMLKWIRDLGWNVHRAKNSKGTVLGNYIMSNPEVFEVVDEGSTMISPDTPVIPEGAGPDIHREDHVVWADLRHKATGEIWYVGCVHLVPSKHLGGSTLELWKKQAKATAAWLERQGDIAIVLGDFNCDAGHADANILAKNAAIRTDISHGQRAIDWIVVKNHELTSSTSGTALPRRQQSDHKPVLSTVIRTSEEDAALREELEGLKVKVAELEKQFNDFVTASKEKDTATAELLDDLAEHLAED